MDLLTYSQARGRGIPRSQLSTSYRRILHGVYAPHDQPVTLATLAEAAVLVLGGDATVTGATALHLHSIRVGRAFPLLLATTRRTSRREIRTVTPGPLHLPGLADPALAIADARLTLAEQVMAADAALRLRLTSLERLAQVPGLRRCRELADPRAESLPESRLRVILVEAGLPPAEPQVVVTDAAGHFIARVDLAYREQKVCVEYEGLQHATDTDQWNRDIERYRRLEAAGWLSIRVTSTHLRNPEPLVQQVAGALRSRGRRVRTLNAAARWSGLAA